MNTNKFKSIINLTVVLLIFYCSSLSVLIPINLFKIDLKTCSDTTYNIIRIIPNVVQAILLIIIYRKTLKDDFKTFKKDFGNMSDIAIKYWLIGFLAMIISNKIIISISPVKIANNEEGVRQIINSIPFISFFAICIFAPIAEELIFRKAFKDCFKEKWLFILMSGIVFGLLHVIGSINSLYDLLYILPYSSLGIAFAYIYYKTDNIYSSIFVHCLHNSVLVVLNILLSGVILLWMNLEQRKILI